MAAEKRYLRPKYSQQAEHGRARAESKKRLYAYSAAEAAEAAVTLTAAVAEEDIWLTASYLLPPVLHIR